ncbi:hypothetical protein HK101_001401 [Irineochytrium annulatum]|nr:hypothetical protein HK101_001401 [Irineochytrium annulatum]
MFASAKRLFSCCWTSGRPSFYDFYEKGNLLGKGAFAAVYEATRKEDGATFAVKIIDVRHIKDRAAIDAEVDVLREIGTYPNIISLHDSYTTPDEVFLVTDLATGGELFDKIIDKGRFTEKDAAEIVTQLLHAMAFYFSHGIVHRDLKPENLLLLNTEEHSPIMITDFGLAKFATDDHLLTMVSGTPAYVAPEVLDKAGHGKPVDVWALGVITYILLCGYAPFWGETQSSLFTNILGGKYDFDDEPWPNISQHAKDFISAILVRNPDQRPTVAELLEHTWLKTELAEVDLLPTIRQNFHGKRKFKAEASIRKFNFTRITVQPKGSRPVPSKTFLAIMPITNTMYSFIAVLTAIVATAVAQAPSIAEMPLPGRIAGDTVVHDPAIIRSPVDGSYLVYGTATGISVMQSTDRVNFKYIGAVFPEIPSGCAAYLTPSDNGNIWAPDVHIVDGEVVMYYCCSKFGTTDSAIFLATSRSGLPGTFTDRGMVLSTPLHNSFNAIDPNLIIENNKWWLSFGSFGTGIHQVRLDPTTMKPHHTSYPVQIASRPDVPDHAQEAPFVFFREGYFYLITAWDFCCRGAKSDYKTIVGRSKYVNGPYEDADGKLMTEGGGSLLLVEHGPVIGPGGMSHLKDGDQDLIVYHYYTDDGGHQMGINLLSFNEAGWPTVI